MKNKRVTRKKEKHIKILYIIPSKTPTGPHIAILNMAIGISKNLKMKIFIITPKSFELNYKNYYEKLRESASIYEVSFKKQGILYWLSLAIKAFKLALSKHIDIIHTASLKILIPLGVICKLIPAKLILSLEGNPLYEMFEFSLFNRMIIILNWVIGMRLVDLILPCSKWLKSEMAQYPFLQDKLSFLHNPIDFERFQNAKPRGIRQEIGVPEKAPMILTVGRLHPVKDIETFLKAAEKTVKHYKNAWFVIVGDGPLRKNLENITKQLKISKHVVFTGFRHDVERFMAAADIYVMTSVYEPFGLVVAEAMAAGKPVIVTNVGGMPEIVGDAGLTVDARDVDALAEAMLKLLKDEELRRKLSEKARERIEKSFSAESVGERLVQIYGSLLKDERQ